MYWKYRSFFDTLIYVLACKTYVFNLVIIYVTYHLRHEILVFVSCARFFWVSPFQTLDILVWNVLAICTLKKNFCFLSMFSLLYTKFLLEKFLWRFHLMSPKHLSFLQMNGSLSLFQSSLLSPESSSFIFYCRVFALWWKTLSSIL